MKQKLQNQIIYITGASAGIGLSTAELCLKEGATVVITGRNEERLNEAELILSKISSNVIAHLLDVSIELDLIESLNDVYKKFGRIDGLVNNAPSIHTGKIIDLDMPSWRTNFKANLDAVFIATKTVLPWMISAKKGSIVNVASVVALRGTAYMSGYGAAKAGLDNFSKT